MPKAPRRTGIEDCVHYLGKVGALMFFARAALAPEAKGTELLRWTGRLQQAQLKLSTDPPLKPLTIAAPQISTWRRANPIVWTPPKPAEQTLRLRVLAVEVAQEPALPTSWKGHLLIIYEPHTETLVHHFLKQNRTADVSADWILYALARADQEIRSRATSGQLPQDSVSIALPDLQEAATPYASAYMEAAQRLRTALSAGGLTATWLGRHKASLTLHNAHIDEGAPRFHHEDSTLEEPRFFTNTLIRAARAFNTEDLCDSHRAAWIALNPQKGNNDRKPGWADRVREEKRRQQTTTSQN